MIMFEGEPDRFVTVYPDERESVFGSKGTIKKPWRGVTVFPRSYFEASAAAAEPGGHSDDEDDPAFAGPCLVEACCEADSLLSRPSRWTKGRKVVCISKEDDITSQTVSISRLLRLPGQVMPYGHRLRARGVRSGFISIGIGVRTPETNYDNTGTSSTQIGLLS